MLKKKNLAKGANKSTNPYKPASQNASSSDPSRRTSPVAAKPASLKASPASVPATEGVAAKPASLKASPASAPATEGDHKPARETRVIVKFDAGFPNQLFIRGSGANLSWDEGRPLRNVKSDEWLWVCESLSSQCEFKVLLNDEIYEEGKNHSLSPGASLLYTPLFSRKNH